MTAPADKLVTTVKLTIHDRVTHGAITRLKETNKMSAFVCAALHEYVRSPLGQKLLDVLAPE